jgi:hypothetical protein
MRRLSGFRNIGKRPAAVQAVDNGVDGLSARCCRRVAPQAGRPGGSVCSLPATLRRARARGGPGKPVRPLRFPRRSVRRSSRRRRGRRVIVSCVATHRARIHSMQDRTGSSGGGPDWASPNIHSRPARRSASGCGGPGPAGCGYCGRYQPRYFKLFSELSVLVVTG